MGWFSKKMSEKEREEQLREMKKEVKEKEERERKEKKESAVRFAHEQLSDVPTKRLLLIKESAIFEMALYFSEKEFDSFDYSKLDFSWGDYNVIKGSSMDSLVKFFSWWRMKRALAAELLVDSVNVILEERGLDKNGNPKTVSS